MHGEKNRLTIEEAAGYLDQSVAATYRRARIGQLPGCVRLGRSVVIIKPDFLAAFGLTDTQPLEANQTPNESEAVA